MKMIVEKFAFDTTCRPPLFCEQHFREDGGMLVHNIDGTDRAYVMPENVAAYLAQQTVTAQETEEIMAAMRPAAVTIVMVENPEQPFAPVEPAQDIAPQ